MNMMLSRQQGVRPMGRSRASLQVSNVAVPTKPPSARQAKRSKVEILKEKSDFLRHPLMEELVNENPFINEDAMQLMKFHGSYMQDHREKRAFGQGKFYQFMMRTRQPGGLVTNQLYLVMDDLADQVRCMHACYMRAAVHSARSRAAVLPAAWRAPRHASPCGAPHPPASNQPPPPCASPRSSAMARCA